MNRMLPVLLCVSVLILGACATVHENVQAALAKPAQAVYLPPGDKGPIVVVISGASGPPLYREYSAEVARLGYYTVLIDGNDVRSWDQGGAQNLQAVIARAQSSPHAVPGKAAVIGFSMGGGGALAHAAALPEFVSAVIAYYPQLNRVGLRVIVEDFRVPVLVLTGERDRDPCCPIASMRRLEEYAKDQQAAFRLVAYPDADHGFNLAIPAYRKDAAEDAWRRTTQMLAEYHPVR